MKDIIFDIDGTLSNLSHREHYVKIKPRNWAAFNELILNDSVHEDIVWLLKLLKQNGNRIIICTARTDDLKEKTVYWLNEIAKLKNCYDAIYMRKAGDHRDDNIIKKELLDQIRNDGYNPTIVFDDRDKVVKMWRDNGLRTLQVNYGDF